MKLHGWIMSVVPGEEHKTLEGGYCDVTWQLYETHAAGLDSIETELPDDWETDRVQFMFADDMRDYAGLDGIVAYRRLNPPEGSQYAPVRLGKAMCDTVFVLCGVLDGVDIPFHTEDQALEVVQWFITKQVGWHDAYSKGPDGEAAPEASAEEAGGSPWSAERGPRKTVH